MPIANNKKKCHEAFVLDRRREYMREYLKGRTLYDIAKQFKVCTATVCNDLKALRLEVMAEGLIDAKERMLIESSRLDLLESEAWGAWEMSKKYFDKEGKERERAGNLDYWHAAMSCWERRVKLFNLIVEQAPPQQNVTVVFPFQELGRAAPASNVLPVLTPVEALPQEKVNASPG